MQASAAPGRVAGTAGTWYGPHPLGITDNYHLGMRDMYAQITVHKRLELRRTKEPSAS